MSQHYADRIYLDEDKRDFIDWRMGSGNTVEIYDLQVGSLRRIGRGRRLINSLIDMHIPRETKMIFAITRAENFVAQQFYEEMRFRVVGVLRYFYQDGAESVDAVMYGRDLGSQA